MSKRHSHNPALGATAAQVLPVAALTSGPYSHFFGFHDLCPFDETEHHVLALGVDFLDRPPGPHDIADIKVIDLVTNECRTVARTTAWNFPQGARQQWWPGRPGVHVFNQRDAAGELWAVAATVSGTEVARWRGGIYAFSPGGETAYAINFSRLHFMGGYGYADPALPQNFAPCPEDDGIYATDTVTGAQTLIVSIAAVARLLGQVGPRAPAQYLTHVLPSPSGGNLCFLHRSWLADGGVTTSVAVCARDGSDLRILASGFYSHFDWRDDSTLLFWGRAVDRLHGLRSKRAGWVGPIFKLGRPVWRLGKKLLGLGAIVQESYYLIDVATGTKTRFLPEALREDGHPCFLRARPGWFTTDTYPDNEGFRRLLVVDSTSGAVCDLGRLGTPTLARREAENYLRDTGVGSEAIIRHGAWRYFNSRSGYSCDFHPRFDRHGRRVCLDSLHTGQRQIYIVEVATIVL